MILPLLTQSGKMNMCDIDKANLTTGLLRIPLPCQDSWVSCKAQKIEGRKVCMNHIYAFSVKAVR